MKKKKKQNQTQEDQQVNSILITLALELFSEMEDFHARLATQMNRTRRENRRFNEVLDSSRATV